MEKDVGMVDISTQFLSSVDDIFVKSVSAIKIILLYIVIYPKEQLLSRKLLFCCSMNFYFANLRKVESMCLSSKTPGCLASSSAQVSCENWSYILSGHLSANWGWANKSSHQ